MSDSSTSTSHVWPTIKFIVVSLFVFVTILFCYSKIVNFSKFNNFQTAKGVVTTSSIAKFYNHNSHNGHSIKWCPRIEYLYGVGSEIFKSKKISFSIHCYYDELKANEFLFKYAKGNSVTVYYDPKNKNISILEPPKLIFKKVSTYIIAVVSVFYLIYIFYYLRQFKRRVE